MPHVQDFFKLSTDPQFVDKVVDVVGLYHHPSEAAVALCVDEKSGVQALDRAQPVLPMMPGMPERATHSYVRHGTTSLFAAFNIADGSVISALHRQHRAVEFRKFLIAIDKAVPADLDVHLICDNLTTHKTPAIRDWLAAIPASTRTSPPPDRPGSTRSNAGSGCSPTNSSGAGSTRASWPWRTTSGNRSTTRIRTRNRRSEPGPPRTFSSPSEIYREDLRRRAPEERHSLGGNLSAASAQHDHRASRLSDLDRAT
jgi:hypothetical protein